jgi:hypothetical protein
MSDPRGESSRDMHIQEVSVSPGSSGERGDTRSATYEADPSRREAMQQELMDLGVWLTEHPKVLKKNLKPIRGSVVLDPGVYYNTGTGMVERIYSPQHIALGARWFRVKSDPAAPVEEIRRRALEGK